MCIFTLRVHLYHRNPIRLIRCAIGPSFGITDTRGICTDGYVPPYMGVIAVTVGYV